MTNMVWNVELVSKLTELWAGKLSATLIAQELGEGFTRCSIIGKAHRLGLPARPRNPPKQARLGNRPSASVHRIVEYADMRGVESPIFDFDPVDDVPPDCPRKSFLELTRADCHWPIGDPQSEDFCFCAAPAFTGKPYCLHHCRMAYLAPDTRSLMRLTKVAA